MRRISLFATAIMLVLMVCAEQPRAPRVDFSSKPDGADVIIDGVTRGVTPITLFDIVPGTVHHIRLELKNHESADDFFSVEPGNYLSRHYELAGVKGLLLVTSEPSGAAVMLDGYSLGETPRLITSLDAQEPHKLVLQKAGYQNVLVDVKFNGRSPLVKHEKLILDSGTLTVTSEPSGANVTVNGVLQGQTPVTVKDVPKGRATVIVEHKGYLSETREVVLNAGDERSLDVKLEGLPGALLVTSVPGRARVYVNGSYVGNTPLTMQNLKPGQYDLRTELDGYVTMSRQVTISLGAKLSEEFKLLNNQGRLEVRTSPVGAQVYVDGKLVGTTKSNDSRAALSDALQIEKLGAGEHVVTVKKDGYGEAIKHPVVVPGKSSSVRFALKRVFTPNIEIVTANGVYRGVLVANNPETVEVEVSMGVTRSFNRMDIKEINILGQK